MPQEDKVYQRITIEFHDFLDVFYKQSLKVLPIWKKWDHKIELKEGFKTRKARVMPMIPKEKEISAFVKENLTKGFIWLSYSLQTSAVFLIPKKDRGKLVVTDYRHLNSMLATQG